MLKQFFKKFLFLALFLVLPNYVHAIAAFPGAEGFGSETVGGRGGVVMHVTNLNDSGAGSFRSACEATGARIVVFEVSGHIRLTTTIKISNPYISIYGQTSPGGVDISGGMFMVNTHDVIVQHMRFRMSSDVCDGISYPNIGNCETYGDTVRIMGTAYSGDNLAEKIIFDHCSMSWGNDETLDIGGYYGLTDNVTISNSIIAQGLDDPAPEPLHGYGINIGSHFQNFGVTKVSMHHNYIAHFRMRLPQVSFNGFADLRNNVMYNWENRGAILMDEIDSTNYHISDYQLTRINAIGNHFKSGLLNPGWACDTSGSGIAYYGESYSDCIELGTNYGRGQFYLDGNTGCSNGRVWYGYSSAQCTNNAGYFVPTWLDQVASNYMASFAHNTDGASVTTTAMNSSLISNILSVVGANYPFRDSVDEGFVNDYANNTGRTLSDNHYPNNYPTFSSPPAPVDNDRDGMADAWESNNSLNISVDDSGSDFDNDGYSNIEEYVFYIGGYINESSSEDQTAPAAPVGLNVL